MKIGIVINSRDVRESIASAKRVEELGFEAVWLTSGAGAGDALTTLAAVAPNVSKIKLGTSIVQTLPRHPMVMAGETYVLSQLAPGRFRLGLGPSHKPLMDSLGLPFVSPLGHLEEYVAILKTLFANGKVEFQGKYLKANISLPTKLDVPVMIGALRENAFTLAGKATDGAITWLCPAPYLEKVGVPALKRGAQAAGRAAPPLITHLAVCVTDDAAALRAAVRATIGNIRLPFYQRMLADAGFPEALQGEWSDRAIDGVIAWGSEKQVAQKLEEMRQVGASEILVRPIALNDPDSVDRTLRALAPLAKG